MNSSAHDWDVDVIEADPLLGARVGSRYLVKGVLGEGGMGIVYDAVHEQLERHVAIKVIRHESLSPRMIERFRREAITVSGLGHPNIIDIHDVGVLDDGRPFMVMPKLNGHDLSEDLEAGRMFSVEEVVNLLEGPARALDMVHKRGIVHRDLKPENLFIEILENGDQIVKVVDFGLAAPQSPDARRLTKAGMITGTPEYMSPESARGNVVDGRSDVYSLAVVAFELLTGTLPFFEGEPFDIVVAKTQVDAPSLGSRGFDASEALEEVFATALARDPDNRHALASEFISALASVDARATDTSHTAAEVGVPVLLSQLASEAPTNDPSSPANETPGMDTPKVDELALALPTRRRLPLLLVALGALAALLGVGWWTQWRESPATDAAEELAEVNPAPSDSLDDVAEVAPEPPSELVVDDSTGQEEAPPAQEALPQPDPPVQADPPTPPRTRSRPDRPARVAESSPVTDGTEDVLRSDTPELDPAAARALHAQGTSALVRGRIPEAIGHFRSATLAAPGYGPAWRGLGLAYERIGRGADARRAFERYLQVAGSAADADAIRARIARL